MSRPMFAALSDSALRQSRPSRRRRRRRRVLSFALRIPQLPRLGLRMPRGDRSRARAEAARRA
jgi:hypothetical protein